MKKLFVLVLSVVLFAGAASAQSYRTSIGLGLDFGNGTWGGPSLKHFFNEKGAVQAEFLFGNNAPMASFYYQYHGAIANAGGLKYYLGVGPSLVFPKGGDVTFGLRPVAGLDFNLPKTPLAMSFDWRPAAWFASGNNDFEAGRFGFGVRYVLR